MPAQHEDGSALRSGPSSGTSIHTSSHTAKIVGPISLMPRVLETSICEALDAVPAERLPEIRHHAAAGEAWPVMRRALDQLGFGPDWLSDWLAEDIDSLARLFADLTGAEHLLLRLEAVGDNACRRFHTDNVRYRLVTTYRGPGTEWIDPRAVANLAAGAPLPESAIRQLDRGCVAVMRGSRDAHPDRPGVLHRSPPIEGSGVTRLFLAIDETAEDSGCACGDKR